MLDLDVTLTEHSLSCRLTALVIIECTVSSLKLAVGSQTLFGTGVCGCMSVCVRLKGIYLYLGMVSLSGMFSLACWHWLGLPWPANVCVC